MSSTVTEKLIDVRPMPPRLRHATIFETWDALADGDAIQLVNDHDPLPLYYQFGCEYTGNFRWEYLDEGPAVWRVRITKGAFADPGFKPTRKATHCCTTPIRFADPLVVDTRPIFAAGETPCAAIDTAVERLIPGQPLVLLVPFEPVPLYSKLTNQGFSHRAEQTPDGTWRIEFRKTA